MSILSPEEQAFFKMKHQQLVERQAAGACSVLFESCNVDTAHSLIFVRCDCTTNPNCTGFILGTIDFEHGSRAVACPTRAELQRLAESILKAIGQ